MRLLGLDKDCFSSWWARLPEGSTMVVQPKIDGCAIGLRYKYGQLVDAYSRDDSEEKFSCRIRRRHHHK